MRDEPENLDLRRVLPELKRRGCTMLVTGEVNPTVSMRASRRMFGEVTGERARVLGLTRQAAMRPDAWLPASLEVEADSVDLVELSQPSRLVSDTPGKSETIGSVTASMVDAIDREGSGLDREDSGLDREGSGLDREGSEFGREGSGLGRAGRGQGNGDGRLRVGVYSLLPLEGRYGKPALERFVREVGECVRAHGGMGHLHFPRADDDAIVGRLDQYVDVRVELRQLAAANPTPEQRWHVDGSSSRWVEL